MKQIVLASRPKGTPSGKNFRFEDIALPSLKEGEVLLAPLYISVDPYMRGRMDNEKSYIPPFEVDRPIDGAVLAEIIDSKSEKLKKGDKVTGMLPWATQSIEKADNLLKIEPSGIQDSYYLGILGFPGLAAFFGIMDICKPKKGDTVVVSGAAGAVGSTAGQIAKILECRVIGIAGSHKKAEYLKSIGFDEVINYKTASNMAEAIAKTCPDGVDCYFDNVGGPISDAVIFHLNFHAKMALCGQIALYNDENRSTGPRFLPHILTRSVLIKGFIVMNYQSQFPQAIKQLSEWIQDEKLTFSETIIEGFDKIPEAFLGLFKGQNKGKMLVRV